MTQKPFSSKVPAKFFYQFFQNSLDDALTNLYLHPYTAQDYQDMFEKDIATFHLNIVTTKGGTDKIVGFVVKKLDTNTYSGISLFGQNVDFFSTELQLNIQDAKKNGLINHLNLNNLDLSVVDFFLFNVYTESQLITKNGKINSNVHIVGDCFGDFLSSGYGNSGWETTETYGFAKQYLSPESRISYKALRNSKSSKYFSHFQQTPTFTETRDFIKNFHQTDLSYHELKTNPTNSNLTNFRNRFFDNKEQIQAKPLSKS